jgi:hypothetical protein
LTRHVVQDGKGQDGVEFIPGEGGFPSGRGNVCPQETGLETGALGRLGSLVEQRLAEIQAGVGTRVFPPDKLSRQVAVAAADVQDVRPFWERFQYPHDARLDALAGRRERSREILIKLVIKVDKTGNCGIFHTGYYSR